MRFERLAAKWVDRWSPPQFPIDKTFPAGGECIGYLAPDTPTASPEGFTVQALRRISRLACPVLLAGLLVLAGTAAPAAARTVEHVPFSFPIEETVGDLCNFPVQLHGESSGHVEAFRSDTGGFVKVILHFHNDFTLSANGKSLTERDRFNEFDVNFNGGGAPTQVITSGLFVHIRLPSGGVVIAAGRVVVDVVTDTVLFEAGNQPLPFSSRDQAALCAALS
jgi:hypothetical protein